MAAKNNKAIKTLPQHSGQDKLTDGNIISILVKQMQYLSNTLHHYGYFTREIAIMFDGIDINTKDTIYTHRNVSNALIVMNVLYDLLSYLEQEVQCLRNGKSMGSYLLKKVPDNKKRHEQLLFRYDDRLDADKYYENDGDELKTATNNKKLRKQFYNLYDDIEHSYDDCKEQFRNYLKLITKFEMHYELKTAEYGIYILYDTKHKTSKYVSNDINELLKHPLVYLKDFVEFYGTNKDTYVKSTYEFKERLRTKKIDEGISALSNIISENNMRNETSKYVTFYSLNMSSKPFIEYLTGLVKSFTLTKLDTVSYFYLNLTFMFSFMT